MAKQNYFFSNFFHANVSQGIEDVTLWHKRKSKTSTDNYRPISILPNNSKLYERCIYNHMQQYFDNILSKYQCGFCKGYNSQHCLIKMIEKWCEGVDKGGAFGTLLADLSKAFHCLPHELLIAKIHAYGFDMKSLNLIYNYLSNGMQKLKVGEAYSSRQEILYGVPQRSINFRAIAILYFSLWSQILTFWTWNTYIYS